MMSDQKAKETAASEEKNSKREQSTIVFPYGDLDDAVEVAKAIHAVGGQSCSTDQLAGQLKQSAASGAFRLRLSYPRIFGLTEMERGEVRLTQLGLKMVDANQEQQARSDAFLTVPLYKAIYDKYKGYTLPPAAAIEREMVNLGVSSKQKDKARQIFSRAAQQAGFFAFGTDCLVAPNFKNRPDTKPLDVPPSEGGGGGGTGGNGGGGSGFTRQELHPFIEGLLKTLPKPETDWSTAERKKWLNTAENIFGLIYKDEAKDAD